MRRQPPLSTGGSSHLDAHAPITDNSDIDDDEKQIINLQLSRRRLLVAAAADRRRIERDLHDGVFQQLVALSVNLQRAEGLMKSDPDAATVLLREISRDVKQALEETTQLALRVYPPLDTVGLATTLRAAAASAGVRASVDAVDVESHPAEIAAVLYWFWLELLERVAEGSGAALRIQQRGGALSFDVEAETDGADEAFESLRDRVEALGGRTGIKLAPNGRTHVYGSLPAE